MGNKRKLMDFKGEKLRYDAGDTLRKLGDRIASGAITLKNEDGAEEVLELPGRVQMEVTIKDKRKDGGIQGAIEIEIKWVDADESAE